MKTKLALTTLAAALTFAATSYNPHRAVVVLRANMDSYRINQGLGGPGNGFGYSGMSVYCSSSSSNAPVFPQSFYYDSGPIPNTPPLPKRVDLADAIQQCLSEGFKIQSVSSDGMTVMLVR